MDTFVGFRCHSCHKIDDIKQLEVRGGKAKFSAPLGSEISRIKTYGELVTSVINPSHRLAEGYSDAIDSKEKSKMRVYNDVMTVTQLVDLITFLESHYTLKEYQQTTYPPIIELSPPY